MIGLEAYILGVASIGAGMGLSALLTALDNKKKLRVLEAGLMRLELEGIYKNEIDYGTEAK